MTYGFRFHVGYITTYGYMYRGNHESIRMVGVAAGIRSRHHLHTSQKRQPILDLWWIKWH